MIGMVTAINTFCGILRSRKVVIATHNLANVHNYYKGHAKKCIITSDLIRNLYITCSSHNIALTVIHTPREVLEEVDYLTRGKVEEFLKRNPNCSYRKPVLAATTFSAQMANLIRILPNGTVAVEGLHRSPNSHLERPSQL